MKTTAGTNIGLKKSNFVDFRYCDKCDIKIDSHSDAEMLVLSIISL
jgi:hypothetical protein